MGNASEYKTFNGQIGKRPRNFCSKPPSHGCTLNSVGVTLVTGFNNLCVAESTYQGSTEKTFI